MQPFNYCVWQGVREGIQKLRVWWITMKLSEPKPMPAFQKEVLLLHQAAASPLLPREHRKANVCKREPAMAGFCKLTELLWWVQSPLSGQFNHHSACLIRD